MKKLLIILMLCFISLLFAEDILEGFREYKFGMTIQEVVDLANSEGYTVQQDTINHNVSFKF